MRHESSYISHECAVSAKLEGEKEQNTFAPVSYLSSANDLSHLYSTCVTELSKSEPFMGVLTRIQRFPLVTPSIVKLGVEGPALLLSEAPPSGRAFLQHRETAQAIKWGLFPHLLRLGFTVCCTKIKVFLSVYLCWERFVRMHNCSEPRLALFSKELQAVDEGAGRNHSPVLSAV